MSLSELNTTQKEALRFYEAEISKLLTEMTEFSANEFYKVTREISESFKRKHADKIAAMENFPTELILPRKNGVPSIVLYLGFTVFLKNLLGEGQNDEPQATRHARRSIEAFKYKGHNELDIKETNKAYPLLLD